MTINFLYCIDVPARSEQLNEAEKIAGWLLCSLPIKNITIADSFRYGHTFTYGLPRPDVALSFKEFPGNTTCGFAITAGNMPVSLKEKLDLEVSVELKNGEIKIVRFSMDMSPSEIHDTDVDDDEKHAELNWEKTEKKYFKELKDHPWITIRMDITNKCNLRCIMCHFKEEEIYSQPAKIITPEKLKQQLHDIAPYVKHIMLSCGFEPLISKYFTEIVSMLNQNYPHMEIGLCTNGMLLDSKARKAIIENKITHVLLSLDGVTKNTVEKIRVRADYDKIVSNIMALSNLKKKFNHHYPLLFMDFVLMDSNIHEAPSFVWFCKELGIDVIDFRHLVGNKYFKEHEEMLTDKKEKYNYFRELTIRESRKANIMIRMPEAFETEKTYIPEALPEADLSDFRKLRADIQTLEVADRGEYSCKNGNDDDFSFLSGAQCLRPFNEIMINEQVKIMPCSYYGGIMGTLDGQSTLHSIFFGDEFSRVRRKKIQAGFDFRCMSCPIKSNLLPTDIVK